MKSSEPARNRLRVRTELPQASIPQEPSTLTAPHPSADDHSDLRDIITQEHIDGATLCGQGGFGKVFLVRHATLGNIAMKQLKEASDVYASSDERRRAKREARIWRRLKHRNVLPFVGFVEIKSDFYLVSPYAENGALHNYIQTHQKLDRLTMLTEIAAAVAYLHRKRIIHGDIKAANVLVSGDARAMLCDFGLTRETESATSAGARGMGSVRWMSPELLQQGGGKTFESDVWAFGMLIFEILSGLLPFSEHRSIPSVINALMVQRQLPPMKPPRAPDGTSYAYAWQVAGDCWTTVPVNRPSMDEVRDRLKTRQTRPLSFHQSWVSSVLGWLPKRRESFPNGSSPVSPPPDMKAFLTGATQGSSGNTTVRSDVQTRLLAACSTGPISSPEELLTRRITFASPEATYNSRASIIGVISRHSTSSRAAETEEGSSSSFSDTLQETTSPEPAVVANEYSRPHVKMSVKTAVHCVAFTPDGRVLASGTWGGSIRLWNPFDGAQLFKLPRLHAESVNGLAFSPSDSSLVSCSSDGIVQIWDLQSGKYVWSKPPRKGHTDIVRGVAYAPDGSMFASCSDDTSIRLWDASSNDPGPVTELRGYGRGVKSVSFAPDSHTLVSGSGDTSIRIWDIRFPRQPKQVLLGHTQAVTSVTFKPLASKPGGQLQLASGSLDRTVRIWELEAGPSNPQGRVLTGKNEPVLSVAYCPSGRNLASGQYAPAIKMWDVDGSSTSTDLHGHVDCVNSVAFSPDGEFLASASNDRFVRVWSKTSSSHS